MRLIFRTIAAAFSSAASMAGNVRYFPLPSSVGTYGRDDYVGIARTLSEKCWDAVEGQDGPKACRGSLYCGELGPGCYLRWRLATHFSATSSSSSSSSSTTRSARGGDDWTVNHPPAALLRDGLTAARSALRRGSHRHGCTLLEGRISGALAMKCALLAAAAAEVGVGSSGGGEEVTELRSTSEELLRLGRGCRSPVDAMEESECEVLYGRAGYLQALLLVRSVLPLDGGDDDGDDDGGAAVTYGRDVAITLIRTIIENGVETSREYRCSLPLLWQWHGSLYLGAAHGVVGVLHTLLCFLPELREAGNGSNRDAVSLVRTTLDRLDELCFPTGNLRSSVGRERDKLVHWCHGAPGYVLLLVKAHEVFKDTKYLRRAEEVARNVVYRRGLLRKGAGLCHGISGNAYCFLAVRRGRRLEAERRRATVETASPPSSTGEEEDDEWLRMARTFAGFAIDRLSDLEPVPDRPHSLYEGIAGLAALLLDLAEPDGARFPCYEF